MTCLGITALVGTFNLMFETQDVVFGDKKQEEVLRTKNL